MENKGCDGELSRNKQPAAFSFLAKQIVSDTISGPGALPSSANQCIHGKVYLRSNLLRKQIESRIVLMYAEPPLSQASGTWS